MRYTFPSDKSVEFSFNVGVAGTSTSPQSVAVVLEKGTQALSYFATKVDDRWVVVVDKPGQTFGCGPVKLSINVVLNNRLFTPMKVDADIFSEAPTEEIPSEEIPVAPQDGDTPAVASQDDMSTCTPTPFTEPVVRPRAQLSAADIKSILGTATKQVVISQPKVRLQLLKTIESGRLKEAVEKAVVEAVKPKDKPVRTEQSSVTIFSLKRTKIVTR
jgi:hypothetical protein